jgi:hypothetical protein
MPVSASRNRANLGSAIPNRKCLPSDSDSNSNHWEWNGNDGNVSAMCR